MAIAGIRTIFSIYLIVLAADIRAWTSDLYNKAGTTVRSSLRCDGNGLEFTLPDDYIFQTAFKDTINFVNFTYTVESVRIGTGNELPECLGQRYPPDRHSTSTVVAVLYSQCGVIAREDLETEIIMYSAKAHIFVTQAPTTGGTLIRKIFDMGLNCQGLLREQTFIDNKNYQHTTALETITVPFDITFSLTANQTVYETFGNLIDVNVHVITIELDEEFRSLYRILGNRCWATGTMNSSSTPSYEFVASQGCASVGLDYATQVREDHKHVVEIASFEFEPPTSGLYFYCDVNVCLKNDENQSRCKESCLTQAAGRSGVRREDQDQENPVVRANRTAADFRLSSGRTITRSDIPPAVIVSSSGTPYIKPKPTKVPNPEFIGFAWYWYVVIATGIMVTAVCVFVYCCRRRRSGN